MFLSAAAITDTTATVRAPDSLSGHKIAINTPCPLPAQSDVKLVSVTIAGVDTDGDTILDMVGPPSSTLGSVISDDGFDNDGDTLVDEDPVDGIDNDGDTAVDEDGAIPITIVVDTVLHNNGPSGPTKVALSYSSGIVATGAFPPAGLVPANCTLTKVAGPD